MSDHRKRFIYDTYLFIYMKKKVGDRKRLKAILLTLAAVVFVGFVIFPLSMKIFDGSQYGNVALIPIEGGVTTTGGKLGGERTIPSDTLVQFVKAAEEDSQIKVIMLEINCPGGTPVATDEVVEAIKKAEKPVIAVIREVGASGGYWIASASDHIIANRMAMTGSIGVRSSWLEFSGLMEKYGVGYEQVNGGEYKEFVSPYKKMQDNEKALLQKSVDKIHQYFISGVAENRGLSLDQVSKLATGEVFLGVEAFNNGLVDQLGNKDTAEEYIKDNYDLEKIDYVVYEQELGFLDLLTGLSTDLMFNVGQGIGSMLLKENNLMLI